MVASLSWRPNHRWGAGAWGRRGSLRMWRSAGAAPPGTAGVMGGRGRTAGTGIPGRPREEKLKPDARVLYHQEKSLLPFAML